MMNEQDVQPHDLSVEVESGKMKIDYEESGIRITVETELSLPRDRVMTALSKLFDDIVDERYQVIVSALKTDRKITCIQKVRQLTGMGLKDAKDVVEKLEDNGMLSYIPLTTNLTLANAKIMCDELIAMGFAAFMEDM
jgi:hypothetical protein